MCVAGLLGAGLAGKNLFGGGDFFFNQGAQNPAFDFVQEDVHGVR